MSATKKIVHLTSVHARYDQRIFRKECRGLARKGVEVILIVADGKGDVTTDGVRIFSVPAPLNRVDRLINGSQRILRKAMGFDADIYHIHDPELLIVGLLLRVQGRRVVFDMHEDAVVQIKIKPYLNRVQQVLFSSLYGALEAFAIRRLSGLVAATDGLVAKYGHLSKRSAAVPNYVDTFLFPERVPSFERAVIFHPGALNRARGLENMVALARCLPRGSELLLAGPLAAGYDQKSLEPARYLGVLDERATLETYGRSNIGVILYNAVGQYGGATAVKAYEYMAAAMPIIMPDHGEWPEFNRRVQCGLNVTVDDPESVKNAVDWMLANPIRAAELGLNGRKYVLENCDWKSSLGALVKLYDDVLKF